MNYRKRMYKLIAIGAVILAASIQVSCNHFREELPECRLQVGFEYDYNMASVDLFQQNVGKVELYVFDEDGKFLMTQSQQGDALAVDNYRMDVEIPFGKYKLMAWASTGDDNSYEKTDLTPGQTSIDDVRLKLKREASLVVDKEIDELWYGEILDINFKGTRNQIETINLIKDTNTIRFAFIGNKGMNINLDDYDYEIVYDNGYLNYDNSLLADDIMSYRPYYTEQRNESTAVVEMNTMRLIEKGNARFIVTKKAAGVANPVLDINLIDYLVLTRLQEHSHWDEQQYLDREDSYRVVFILSESSDDTWLTLRIYVNDYLCYYQEEDNLGGL